MAITRLMHEASFDDAETRLLAAAYEAALQLLALKDRDDPVTRLLAEKTIEVFRAGQRDPAKICARVLTELGVPLPESETGS